MRNIKGYNARDKIEEWKTRQVERKRYINSLSSKFGAQTITILRERKKARKEAKERYIQAGVQRQIKDSGRVFIMDIDAPQSNLDYFKENKE